MQNGFYFIDPIEDRLHPNIGLIYARLQTSKEYSNQETVRKRNEKMLNSAKKAFAVKGKSRINSIYDYVICFAD